jgi:hypothetical protein
MSTCKECIHEIVCDALIKTGLPWADGEYPAEAFCLGFKGKNDLVEVVRCKDCVCFNNNMPTRPFCDYFGAAIDLMHFCSYGKRKDS